MLAGAGIAGGGEEGLLCERESRYLATAPSRQSFFSPFVKCLILPSGLGDLDLDLDLECRPYACFFSQSLCLFCFSRSSLRSSLYCS